MLNTRDDLKCLPRIFVCPFLNWTTAHYSFSLFLLCISHRLVVSQAAPVLRRYVDLCISFLMRRKSYVITLRHWWEKSIGNSHVHGWRTAQRREWILDELRNRFCTIFATWHIALAIRYLHALIQEGPYICNHNVMYTPVRWYLRESHHKCSHMCLWRDVYMQRIIDEPKLVVTDYLRRCNRLLTTG